MSGSAAKRVILADDHPVVLGGLRALLASTHEFQVVAACSSGAEALRTIRDLEPDIAVLDVHMPELTGVEVLEAVNEEGFGTRVVLLTASATDEQIARGAQVGAWGILLKDTAADELLECLRTVAAANRWLPRHVVDAAFEREEARRRENGKYNGVLTPREQEITTFVAQGLSNKEIARKTGISEGTVKLHLHNIYQKLDVSNRTALATLAQRHLGTKHG